MLLSRRVAPLLLALLAFVVPVLAGCSGSGGGAKQETASQLLARAKKTLDDTQSLHFTLSSTGAPSGGNQLLGGEGDIARPSSFQGTLKVQAAGATVNVKVVSANGTVYAQLPFTSGFSKVDPSAFGVGDPGKLLDPNTGITQLLTAVQNPKLGEEKRVNGEVVQVVTGDIPGDRVAALLNDKDPSKPVHARFSIEKKTGQLREVQLTGPFFTADQDGTYTLQLSGYGEHVEITPPATG